MMRPQLGSELLARRKIQQRRGVDQVLLDHHQTPGSVEHANRELALLARDLVVIQLHGIDGAAAEIVSLGVGAKNAAQQNAGIGTKGMRGWHINSSVKPQTITPAAPGVS